MSNIFHPLTSFDWEKCHELPGRGFYPQCVVLGGKLYVTLRPRCHRGDWELYFSDTSGDLSSWTAIRMPSKLYALAVYRSQLALVGGMELLSALPREMRPTERLWLSKDGGLSWQPSQPPRPRDKHWTSSGCSSLPPMSTPRYMSSATSAGHPECLVVAGGMGIEREPLDTVEVLAEGQWSVVNERLPMECHRMRAVVHNGHWFLMEGDILTATSGLFCKLSSLLSSVTTPHNPLTKTQCSGASKGAPKLWKTFQLSCANASPFVLDGELAITHPYPGSASGGGMCMIQVYSTLSESWVRVQDVPGTLGGVSVGRFLPSSREVVVIGQDRGVNDLHPTLKIFKASIRGLPYNPDSQLTTSGICRLEAEGFSVTAKLSADIESDPLMFSRPVSRLGTQLSTWCDLLQLLRDMSHVELSRQIEQYLLCRARPLKEQCMSVVVSALLQQSSLDPEQLHLSLPQHVPTLLKQNILCATRAHTFAGAMDWTINYLPPWECKVAQ